MTVAEYMGAKYKIVVLNCIDRILADPNLNGTRTKTGEEYWQNSRDYIDEIYDYPSYESLTEKQQCWITQICLNLYKYDKSVFINPDKWKFEPLSPEETKKLLDQLFGEN
jgi:hypothetical protein